VGHYLIVAGCLMAGVKCLADARARALTRFGKRSAGFLERWSPDQPRSVGRPAHHGKL